MQEFPVTRTASGGVNGGKAEVRLVVRICQLIYVRYRYEMKH